MTRYFKLPSNGWKIIYVFIVALSFLSLSVNAQKTKDTTFKAGGHLWGLAYGDFTYKGKADPLNRGGLNQYTGIKESQTMFQFRRIYLGYDYDISKTFLATFLLASEDNQVSTALTPPVTSGDLLSNGKLGIFVKQANLTWKNILPSTDLIFGQGLTPSVLIVEPIWDYRCIERTIADIRRTPTYDLGARLSGKLYNTKQNEIGYNLMVGNGTLAKPENDIFKWFYADVYAKFLDKKMVIDLYADYNRINWVQNWHHDRHMLKGMVAYTATKFTIGAEGFYNIIRKDNIATGTNVLDTLTTKASGISIFARGKLYKDVIGFFIRYDNYDPSLNNNNTLYNKYMPLTATYDPNTKEQFFTAGLDYTPSSKVHIMPNVWYNYYRNAGPVANSNNSDVVYRLSLYYVYGK